MPALTDLTIAGAAEQIASRDISPVELTQAYLDRIARLDPLLNCYITLNAEGALQQAHAAETAIGRGEYLGPLHGIPVALKDLYETAGMRTTAGSAFLSDYLPGTDATAVAKLSAAGAVTLGKLNMHEWAFGLTNDNPHYGACKNPWATERVTGGSSGGSAAALAGGLCMGSLGSDTGGSIRLPAALCGIVGLKSTYGRVSTRGVVPLSWSLDHAGPMARDVRDTAILLQAIAGYDPEDPGSIDVAVDDYVSAIGAGVRGWRIALASDAYFEDADPEVLAAVRAAASIFEQLGAHVEPVAVEWGREAATTNGIMIRGDAATFHQQRLADYPEKFGADVLARLQAGLQQHGVEYAAARRTQTILRRQAERLLNTYDLLLTPASPITAPLRAGLNAVAIAPVLTRFTGPFNFTGMPALALPCGFSAEGMPIGLQIVGRPWSEARILQAGYAYEQATDWHARRPALQNVPVHT